MVLTALSKSSSCHSLKVMASSLKLSSSCALACPITFVLSSVGSTVLTGWWCITNQGQFCCQLAKNTAQNSSTNIKTVKHLCFILGNKETEFRPYMLSFKTRSCKTSSKFLKTGSQIWNTELKFLVHVKQNPYWDLRGKKKCPFGN